MIRPVLAEGEAPAARAALLFVCGIFFGAWSVRGTLPAVLLDFLAAAALVLGAVRVVPRRISRLAFIVLWSGVGFLLGRERIAVPAGEARATFLRLPTSAESVVLVEGVLKDFWSGRAPRARTTLRAERVLGLSPRGSVVWRDFPAEVVVFCSGQSAVAEVADRGDRVRMTGHLEPEELPVSDRERTLPWPRFRLSVKSARLVERRGATLAAVLSWPNRRLFATLDEPAARDPSFDRDVRGPISALLLGRTSELDHGFVARFRRGGLYHLLVISGLHVLLAAGLALFALTAAGIRGPIRDAILLLWLSLFVTVSGANPPATRAGLVVGILLITRLLERPIRGSQAIGLSALLLFAVAPEQIFSVGTVLTFAAVCGIALFSRPIRGRLPAWPNWLWSALAAALAAQCATAPVLLWRFNVVSTGAWLTSPLAVPLAGALIAIGGAVLSVHAIGGSMPLLAAVFAGGCRWLQRLAEGASSMAALRPTPELLGVCSVGALLALAGVGPRGVRRAAALGAGVTFSILALRRGPAGPDAGFSIEILDVGQGDAILLRWKRRAILVDGGGPFDAAATDFGRTRLLPKLLDRGVTRLDAVLLSHPHPDHALGLFAVLEELPVGQLLHSAGDDEGNFLARLESLAREKKVPLRTLWPGDRLAWDDAVLLVLHSGGLRRKTDAVNNQSAVVLFERSGKSALLTGDAGAPTEADLLEHAMLFPVNVLKVGHHGSRTATSPAFVAAVRPRIALLSCGRHNRFGHPAADTLETLARFCVPVLRTDQRSDCRVELSPDGTRLSWRGAEAPW